MLFRSVDGLVALQAAGLFRTALVFDHVDRVALTVVLKDARTRRVVRNTGAARPSDAGGRLGRGGRTPGPPGIGALVHRAFRGGAPDAPLRGPSSAVRKQPHVVPAERSATGLTRPGDVLSWCGSFGI